MATYQKDPPPVEFDSGNLLAGSWMGFIRLPDNEWTPGAGQTEADRPLHTYVKTRVVDANQNEEYGVFRIEDVFPGQVAEMHGHLMDGVDYLLTQKGYSTV